MSIGCYRCGAAGCKDTYKRKWPARFLCKECGALFDVPTMMSVERSVFNKTKQLKNVSVRRLGTINVIDVAVWRWNMITIKCTEKQAMLMEIALDAVLRGCMGQIDHLMGGVEYMRGKCFDLDNIGIRSTFRKNLKTVYFPDLSDNESYGVGNKEIGDAQIAYEMVKVLQNYRSRNMENPWVLGDAPLHYSDEKLMEVGDEDG